MFFQRFEELCIRNKSDVSNTLRALELSTSKGTAWKNGSIPKGDILLKIARHFNTSIDYLLCNTDDPAPPGQKEQPTPVSESELSLSDKKLNELLALASDDTKRLMIDLLERMQNQ